MRKPLYIIHVLSTKDDPPFYHKTNQVEMVCLQIDPTFIKWGSCLLCSRPICIDVCKTFFSIISKYAIDYRNNRNNEHLRGSTQATIHPIGHHTGRASMGLGQNYSRGVYCKSIFVALVSTLGALSRVTFAIIICPRNNFFS